MKIDTDMTALSDLGMRQEAQRLLTSGQEIDWDNSLVLSTKSLEGLPLLHALAIEGGYPPERLWLLQTSNGLTVAHYMAKGGHAFRDDDPVIFVKTTDSWSVGHEMALKGHLFPEGHPIMRLRGGPDNLSVASLVRDTKTWHRQLEYEGPEVIPHIDLLTLAETFSSLPDEIKDPRICGWEDIDGVKLLHHASMCGCIPPERLWGVKTRNGLTVAHCMAMGGYKFDEDSPWISVTDDRGYAVGHAMAGKGHLFPAGHCIYNMVGPNGNTTYHYMARGGHVFGDDDPHLALKNDSGEIPQLEGKKWEDFWDNSLASPSKERLSASCISDWFQSVAKCDPALSLDQREGIFENFCMVFNRRLPEVMADNGITFDDWDLFSGDESYPVPSPYSKFTSEEFFFEVAALDDWAQTNFFTGIYGECRKNLCEYLAQLFKEKGL